jgi:hypothetical protein
MSKTELTETTNTQTFAEIMCNFIFNAEKLIDITEDWYIFNNSNEFDIEVNEDTGTIEHYVPYFVDMHNLHKKICEMLMAKYGSKYNDKYCIVYDYVAPEDGMPAYERIHAFKNINYIEESC